MKKIITVLLTFIVAFSLSISAFAESTTENTVSGLWQLNYILNISYGSPSNSVGSSVIGLQQNVDFTLYGQNKIYSSDSIKITATTSEYSGSRYYKKYVLSFHSVDDDANYNIYTYNNKDGTKTYSSIYTRAILDFGSEPQEVSSTFLSWLNANATRLEALEKPPEADDGSGGEEITPSIEYVYLKENRLLFDTPLTEYSVAEGLLLLLFVVTVLNNIFKSHIKR